MHLYGLAHSLGLTIPKLTTGIFENLMDSRNELHLVLPLAVGIMDLAAPTYPAMLSMKTSQTIILR